MQRDRVGLGLSNSLLGDLNLFRVQQVWDALQLNSIRVEVNYAPAKSLISLCLSSTTQAQQFHAIKAASEIS